MHTKHRVLRNTLLMVSGEALGQLANLLFVVAFARAFGVVEMGHYSLAMAVGAVVSLGVGLGTPAFLVRELAVSPAGAAGAIAALGRLQAASVLLLACGAALALQLRATGSAVMLAAIAYQLVHRAAALYYVPFRAGEDPGVPVVAELAHRAFILAAALLLMHFGAGAGATAAVLPLAALLHALAGRLLVGRRVGPLQASAPGDALRLLRAAAPYFSVLLVSVLYGRGAPILLGVLRGVEAAGTYAVADRLIVMAGLVSTLYAGAAVPTLARLGRHDAAAARRLCSWLLRLLLLLILPSAAALFAFADDIVVRVFGVVYAPAAPLLRVLAVALPLQAAEQLLGSYLGAGGHQGRLARSRLRSLLVMAGIGVPLIHAFDALGLALAVVVGATVQLSGTLIFLARREGQHFARGVVVPPFAAALAAAAAPMCIAGLALPWRMAAFLGVLAAVALATGALRVQELRFVMGLFRRGSPGG